jgi:hypothetical protein
MDNPINALRKFLSGTRGEVSLPEFTSFWKSLEDAEKTEYRTAIEGWDGKSEFVPMAQQAPLALPPAA